MARFTWICLTAVLVSAILVDSAWAQWRPGMLRKDSSGKESESSEGGWGKMLKDRMSEKMEKSFLGKHIMERMGKSGSDEDSKESESKESDSASKSSMSESESSESSESKSSGSESGSESEMSESDESSMSSESKGSESREGKKSKMGSKSMRSASKESKESKESGSREGKKSKMGSKSMRSESEESSESNGSKSGSESSEEKMPAMWKKVKEMMKEKQAEDGMSMEERMKMMKEKKARMEEKAMKVKAFVGLVAEACQGEVTGTWNDVCAYYEQEMVEEEVESEEEMTTMEPERSEMTGQPLP